MCISQCQTYLALGSFLSSLSHGSISGIPSGGHFSGKITDYLSRRLGASVFSEAKKALASLGNEISHFSLKKAQLPYEISPVHFPFHQGFGAKTMNGNM